MDFRKGTETVKKQAKLNYIEWICPVCGKVLKLKPFETKNRQTCGAASCKVAMGTWKKGIDKAKETLHKKNIENKTQIKNEIVEWVLNNKEIVYSCPYNKISSTLSELHDMIFDKFNIKDWRSVYICFDVKNLKELLDKLKEIITSKENIC